ncbi:methionine--tRNA ligase [Patescibacteria group bacterium]|nr:methionine--tRNA ligase [Patescibacteria group bacterium]MBU4057545.1 methionine--tRNA ligase [Patescibacteria group bacterium]MBU4115869.1 methionine--tRNA ligase [Patescibacteria group bacterium]
MITLEEFKKLDIRIGEILSAEKILETDKLIKLQIDLGEESPRQIIAGVAEFFPQEQNLVGKQVTILANLEPRTIRGLESQGMLLAVMDDDKLALLVPSTKVSSGRQIS